jgi:hypothetical protein
VSFVAKSLFSSTIYCMLSTVYFFYFFSLFPKITERKLAGSPSFYLTGVDEEVES